MTGCRPRHIDDMWPGKFDCLLGGDAKRAAWHSHSYLPLTTPQEEVRIASLAVTPLGREVGVLIGTGDSSYGVLGRAPLWYAGYLVLA